MTMEKVIPTVMRISNRRQFIGRKRPTNSDTGRAASYKPRWSAPPRGEILVCLGD